MLYGCTINMHGEDSEKLTKNKLKLLLGKRVILCVFDKEMMQLTLTLQISFRTITYV